MAAGIPDALGDAIAADAVLVAWLRTYQGQPAIFSADVAPPDAEMPYLVIGPPVTDPGNTLLDGMEAGSRDVVRDLRLWAPATGSVADIDTMAERLRSNLSGRLLDVAGWSRARCSIVAGPLGLSADTDAYGRIVSVRVHLTR